MPSPAAELAWAGRVGLDTDASLVLLVAELKRAAVALEHAAERFEACTADDVSAARERAAVAAIREQAAVIRVIITHATLEDATPWP
jgi:hypothetical protein